MAKSTCMSEEYSISNNLDAQTMNNSKLKVFKQRIREVVAEFLLVPFLTKVSDTKKNI